MTTKLQRFASAIALLCAVTVFSGCKTVSHPQSNFSFFRAQDDFSNYTHSTDADGNTVLLSPAIKSHIAWNELIISWNADAPPGTYLKIEASAISPGHQTKFYTVALWSLDNTISPRTSVRGQKDDDGNVDTDTLILNDLANAAQIRVTLIGTNGTMPALKFLGASFSNTKIPVATRLPNHAAWGKIITTPEHSQHGYPNAKGWCSPTSLSMTLSRWADVLNRPEMDLTVPQVAAKVYDTDFAGTGNWPFNTAFAGSFPGMRSYVTRLDDMAEVEDWINAGIPVILSARWDWLRPGRPLDKDGHLITCIGFTADGDVVINDPAAHLDKGDSVRQIYKRADVIHSWTKSHNAVYLVYPVGAKIPHNSFGHWE
ncbi:MAG TPA: C39 family peptidase [Verrucomicrobiae bacterium]|nr:C39 family peptidase [Verrucomicrobiae bacterium]